MNFLCDLFLQDGKQNHVSFPGITQNGSAKQFSHGKYQVLCGKFKLTDNKLITKPVVTTSTALSVKMLPYRSYFGFIYELL